jgi:hypothetical protein
MGGHLNISLWILIVTNFTRTADFPKPKEEDYL